MTLRFDRMYSAGHLAYDTEERSDAQRISPVAPQSAPHWTSDR